MHRILRSSIPPYLVIDQLDVVLLLLRVGDALLHLGLVLPRLVDLVLGLVVGQAHARRRRVVLGVVRLRRDLVPDVSGGGARQRLGRPVLLLFALGVGVRGRGALEMGIIQGVLSACGMGLLT